jgi:hypothetical protein
MDITLLYTGFMLIISSCVSSISSFLTAPYTAWFPIVILAVLAIISILSVIYALAPLIGSISSIRPWVKVKIYELLLSIVLIAIFGSIATALCTENPVNIFNSAGLISSQCTSASGAMPVENIYSLAMCNMYQFNGHVDSFNLYIYYTLVTFAIAPNILIAGLPLTPGTAAFSGSTYGQQINPFGSAGLIITADLGPVELSPLAKANTFENFIIPAMYTFELINQLQLILLGASPYLFAFFMAIGLIARAFGVTRTFGGAMIAFGLGIGFIYPVLIGLNYGFLDHALEHVSPAATYGALAIPAVSPVITDMTFLLGYLTNNTLGTTILTEQLFVYIGIIVIGVTFINILNFMILDAFISDFSSAIGERMSFISLLTNVI